jgi:hypothetical protein
MKINWGHTIFVVLFAAIIFGLISKSYLMAIIISVLNLIGGIIYGLIFGEKKI